jgi:hypothetical protein
VIRYCTASTKKTMASLWISVPYFSFRFLRLAKISERMEVGKNQMIFGRSDWGEDDIGSVFPSIRARYGLQLHVETVPMWIVCLHLEIFCSEQVPRNGTLKSGYFRF